MKRLAFMAGCLAILASGTEAARTITFDDLTGEVRWYGFDCDGDALDDILFTTVRGNLRDVYLPDQHYLATPALGGMALPDEPDLRIDFARGATGGVGFGFAVNSMTLTDAVSCHVYDASDRLLEWATADASYTGNPEWSYPEGTLRLMFGGTASYALCDFALDEEEVFAIDNFLATCDIGYTRGVPAPGAVMLGGFGVALFGWVRWRGVL